MTSALPPTDVIVTPLRVANPVISPNGRSVAFQMMPRDDWELYVTDVDRKGDVRLTNEIQHDHTPRFLTDRQLLAVMGENRHRRSYVYDVASGRRTRLFHNNLLRTVAMEHSWAVSPDGSRVLIVADRDGDTISSERGVYVMDLTAKVGRGEVLERLARMLSEENDLRERGRRMFAAIAPNVRDAVREATVTRVYGYERDLVAFGSKHITQPGNTLAAGYIFDTLESFGYEPHNQVLRGPEPERPTADPYRERDRHPEGDHEPRARVPGQQPLRLGGRRSRRRRRHVRLRSTAGSSPRPAWKAHAGDDQVHLVYRRGIRSARKP